MKKFFLGIAIVLVILLGLMIALPYFFKDEIVAQVKTSANESLNAKLEFKDVSISFFRHFPRLSVGLEQLDISGIDEFDGVRLLYCERLDVGVDLWSAIFGDAVEINSLFLEKPFVNVYVLSNGKANYDITKPEEPGKTPAAESSGGGKIKLDRYEINDGTIVYDDRALGMKAEFAGLDHSGSGEFDTDLYDLTMKTAVEKLSLNYGGIQYLRNARTDWSTTLNANMKDMRFTLKDNDLRVNDLRLLLDGWVQMPENSEDIRMDLKFGTPENTFKSLLSIIPGAYTQDFGDVKANGTVQFGGFVKGTYNEKMYPAFKLDFKVGNADFKYPGLPLGVTNINVDAAISSPDASLNGLVVNIPKFSLRIGSNPLEGYFNLKTPVSDPTVDTKINGTLNLGELSKAFPMEGVQELAGIIRANLTAKASMSQIDRQQYEQVQMAGDFAMQNISYKAAGTPAVKINALETSLSPQKVDIRNFDARLGRSDLRASGSIDNVLAYFSTTKTMTGNLVFSSGNFDANEWMEEPAPPAGAPAPGKVPTDVPAASEKAFDRWDFTVDGRISRLKYDTYDLSDVALKGHFKPNKMDIDNFGLKIGGSDLSGNGSILNAWNYLFDNQTVSGTVNLQSNFFDLNQFMTDEPTAATATAKGAASTPPPPAEIIPVPENMDMTLNANFREVKYTNLTLNNLDGQVVIKNSAARLNNVTADVLGGQVGLNGGYDTRDLAKPAFNMDMAMQNIGFRDAYQNFATVKTFAPIAQMIDGRFNTTLSLSGLLGKDMTPDFTTLSAAGFIETLNAILNNFKPLNEISSKLNIGYLKQLELKNTKNWFEIKNGQVTVKPFNLQMRDVAMQIGGSHGLTSDMNYQILSKIPRAALEKSAVGSAANSGLNLLSNEASKLGVNIAQGEFINVRFDLTGTMASPKVGMKVLGSDGQATIKDQAAATAGAAVQQARDSLTNMATRAVDDAKAKAEAAAKKAADSLRNLAAQKTEEAKRKAEEEAKKRLGEEGQKQVDDVKEKLDKWDPFKKKKN